MNNVGEIQDRVFKRIDSVIEFIDMQRRRLKTEDLLRGAGASEGTVSFALICLVKPRKQRK